MVTSIETSISTIANSGRRGTHAAMARLSTVLATVQVKLRFGAYLRNLRAQFKREATVVIGTLGVVSLFQRTKNHAAALPPTETQPDPKRIRRIAAHGAAVSGAWRSQCGAVVRAMRRGQAGTSGLGAMTIRVWRTHGARSNNPGIPIEPESPRKGSSRGAGDTLHHRCVGCETQGPPRRVGSLIRAERGIGKSTPGNPAERSRRGA